MPDEGGQLSRAIAFILAACEFVILSDRRERRISFVLWNEIRRRSAPQNDSLSCRSWPLMI
jgi:hypothetical protein